MFFLNSRLICFLLLCFFFFLHLMLIGRQLAEVAVGRDVSCRWFSATFSVVRMWPVESGGWRAGTAPGAGRGSLECRWVMVAGLGRGLPDGAGEEGDEGEGGGEEEDGAAGVSPGRWRPRRHRDVAAEATQDIWIAADNEASYMLTGYQPGNLLFSSSSRDKRLMTETKRWFNQPKTQPLWFFCRS